MNGKRSFALAMVVVFAVGSVMIAAQQPKEEKPRNPFKVRDVPRPLGADVKAFAAKVKLKGGPGDPNAAPWVKEKTAAKKNSLDGEWLSRWKGGNAKGKWVTGTARVKSVKNRVYILYSDRTSTYLIEAGREEGGRLVGRFVNTNDPRDTSPWVGVVVDNERIDGVWSQGRWDLRRKIAGK